MKYCRYAYEVCCGQITSSGCIPKKFRLQLTILISENHVQKYAIECCSYGHYKCRELGTLVSCFPTKIPSVESVFSQPLTIFFIFPLFVIRFSFALLPCQYKCYIWSELHSCSASVVICLQFGPRGVSPDSVNFTTVLTYILCPSSL
jgi:hypothetical protein